MNEMDNDKKEYKWLWSFVIPLLVSAAVSLPLEWWRQADQLTRDQSLEKQRQAEEQVRQKQLQQKVEEYCKLWEEQVAIDTAKLWIDFRSDSVCLEEGRQDSLRVSQSYWSAKGAGRSSAVTMSRDKINTLFDNRTRKARNLVEAQTSTMLYQLNAFKKTGMVIKPF